MKERPRYLTGAIGSDALARRKIAMISGPRQVGKSTLAKSLLESPQNYFLYDEEEFRRRWSKSPAEAISGRGEGVVVLDEIHKDRKWKTKLKGLYDTRGQDVPLIVTGSARLEHFRKGGDSLMGRYLPYRLMPLSVAESPACAAPDEILSQHRVNFPWADILRLGGFPEPLLEGNEAQARRWSRLRLDRLVLEDSRDFLNISDLNAFRVLIDLLPERVGSLLSVNSLREDVGKAYATVRSWLGVLDVLYFCFTIRPYSGRLSRSLRAEP
jgi:predicted AAA+ superfamily ATPase